jgi:hypothetical protein
MSNKSKEEELEEGIYRRISYNLVNGKLYLVCINPGNPGMDGKHMNYKACRKRSTSKNILYEDCRGCAHWIDVVEEYQEDLQKLEEKVKFKKRRKKLK